MYIPSFNRVEDRAKIIEFLHRYGFATVISQNDGNPWASHLPVLFDENKGDHGVLRSHMARANQQWKHFHPDREALCIFHGPHAYISPSWYVQQHTVPTWNYAAVHVYGLATVVDDGEVLKKIVSDTTDKYEALMPEPWSIPLTEEELDAMLKVIVGFTIEITRVEAKFKLGQNRSPEDRDGAVRGLLASNHLPSIELGEFTQATLGVSLDSSAPAAGTAGAAP